jgi:hypothetical protein
LAHIYQQQPIQQMRVPVGQQRLRLAAIDATSLGHFEASGCLLRGRQTDLFLEAEPIEKHGKQLAASQRVLKRLATRFGPGFVCCSMDCI